MQWLHKRLTGLELYLEVCYTIFGRGGAKIPSPSVLNLKFFMKPYSYYQTTSISIPKKDDYMTVYYYRKGVVVGMKKQFDGEYQPPLNCVQEQILDENSYNAHLKLYSDDQLEVKH